jgi:hypothetical protein
LRLRQKVEKDPANPHYIRSVRGFGYSFNDSGALGSTTEAAEGASSAR